MQALDDGAHGLLDYLKEHGYDGTHKAIIERFNAENDVATRNAMAKEITSGKYEFVISIQHQLPAGGGQRESRGQGEAPVRHRGRSGGGEGGREPEGPERQAEAHDRHRQPDAGGRNDGDRRGR